MLAVPTYARALELFASRHSLAEVIAALIEDGLLVAEARQVAIHTAQSVSEQQTRQAWHMMAFGWLMSIPAAFAALAAIASKSVSALFAVVPLAIAIPAIFLARGLWRFFEARRRVSGEALPPDLEEELAARPRPREFDY